MVQLNPAAYHKGDVAILCDGELTCHLPGSFWPFDTPKESRFRMALLVFAVFAPSSELRDLWSAGPALAGTKTQQI